MSLCALTYSSVRVSTGYQRALLTSELATIFANAPPSPNASTLASGDVRRAYREAEGIDAEDKFGDLKGSGGIPEKKVPEEGDGQSLGPSRTHPVLVEAQLAEHLYDSVLHQTARFVTTSCRPTIVSSRTVSARADAVDVSALPSHLPCSLLSH